MPDDTLPLQLRGRPDWKETYFPPINRNGMKPEELKQVKLCRTCFKDGNAGECKCNDRTA